MPVLHLPLGVPCLLLRAAVPFLRLAVPPVVVLPLLVAVLPAVVPLPRVVAVQPLLAVPSLRPAVPHAAAQPLLAVHSLRLAVLLAAALLVAALLVLLAAVRRLAAVPSRRLAAVVAVLRLQAVQCPLLLVLLRHPRSPRQLHSTRTLQQAPTSFPSTPAMSSPSSRRMTADGGKANSMVRRAGFLQTMSRNKSFPFHSFFQSFSPRLQSHPIILSLETVHVSLKTWVTWVMCVVDSKHSMVLNKGHRL